MNLRKLTRKSTLGFGQYSDLRVQDLLNLNKTRYLRWVYFANSHINFFDDILDEIKVPIEFRINKPGTNLDFNEIINEVMNNKMDWKAKKHWDSVSKAIQFHKANQNRLIFGENLNELRLKNQGHNTYKVSL
jgi:hypothetical protein